MEDGQIIDMYFKRYEDAIVETKIKYGRLLVSVSMGILKNMEDALECENDTYMKAWNTIPPQKPNILSAFLSKITRNISLDRYDAMNAEKRGGGEMPLLLVELADTLGDSIEIDNIAITDCLNSFLENMKYEARNIFMRRYWFGDSISDIAKNLSCGESKVKMSLSRSRKVLKEQLESAGYLR